MAKKPNTTPTVTLTISTTPQIQRYLEQLARTGLYGKNPAEAAERLVADGIRNLLSDPVIKLDRVND